MEPDNDLYLGTNIMFYFTAILLPYILQTKQVGTMWRNGVKTYIIYFNELILGRLSICGNILSFGKLVFS